MNQKNQIINKFLLIIGLLFNQSIGQSIQEIQNIQNMRQIYEQGKKSQSQFVSPSELQRTAPEIGSPSMGFISPYLPLELEKPEKEIKQFGYDFFTRRDTIAFWENLPTPANYLLGPGDELVISLWGETQLRENYTISRDGKIYDAKVGLLNITGKTIEQGENYLKEQFSRVYATLKGNNPTTFIDVSLGELRSINVNFVGQVTYPGVYPIHPFSTIITGLIQAGGVDTTGSLRNIQIKRDGKLFSTVDLYAYFLRGDLPEKIQLRDQDIVVIPVINSIVTVDSAVVNPGIYEGVQGETVFDLIQYAGGLKPESSSNISIRRIKPIDLREKNKIHENYYIDLENTKLIEVQNGDHISIRSLFQQEQFIQLIGQVKVPGIYNYYKGLNLMDILDLGGGFEDSTFLKSVHKNTIEIIRRDPSSRYEKVITVDFNNLIDTSKDSDILLQNLDRVVVHANLNYFERKNIQILGEVNVPGSYPLLNDNESLQSILTRAGGLSTKSLDNGISIYREKVYFDDPPEDKILNQIQSQININEEITEEENNKIQLAWEGLSVILMPGDSIVVKEKVGAVFVTGEVYNSGLVEFQKGKSIRYYLDSAGGINNYGNRNNVVVVYPNGITVPWRTFRRPKIIDGTSIVVYRKADVTPFDASTFATNTASLLSSLVTIIVLTKQLNSE